MADEVDEADDPRIVEIMNAHQARMKEISDIGVTKTGELCNESLLAVKKHSGLRSAIIDRTLAALGISKPTILLLLLGLLASPANSSLARGRVALAPKVITGTIEKFDDGDTYWLKPDRGDHFKVREYAADAPETAHNSKETDQPGGKEALDYATAHYKGKRVAVTVKGHSYDRVVGKTVADGETKAIGLVLVELGYAEVYPNTRPKPSKDYTDAEAKARAAKLGVFRPSNSPHVTPWEWRAKQREQQRIK